MPDYPAPKLVDSVWLDRRRTLGWIADRCLGTAERLQACEQCLQACPAQALAFFPVEKGTQLTGLESCHGCGRCVASCPSEALFNPDLEQLKREVTRMAAAGKPATLDLVCHRLAAPSSNTLGLHCLHGLPGDQLVGWKARHPHLQIRLHWPQDCSRCPAANVKQGPAALDELGQALGEAGAVEAWQNLRQPATRDFAAHAGQRVSRRQLFARLGPPALPDAAENNPGPAPRRQQRLYRALTRLGGSTLANRLAPWPNLRLNADRCDAHGLCAQLCPAHALQTDAAGDLLFNAQQCLACKSCESHCPSQALSLDYRPEPVSTQGLQPLRSGLQMRCFHCGHSFTANVHRSAQVEPLCAACRKDPARASGKFSAWFG